MNKISTEILIVGGGAAGMAAALSASENQTLRIMVVDDNPRLGGQIWRQEMGKTKSSEARKLIEKIEQNKIALSNCTQVFGQSGEKSLLAETSNGTVELGFEKLVLATGARERFLPFPNWTLPNVFGAAGLQALVKGGLSVKNKEIIVAGTGPLLVAVAEYLINKGAKVPMILEQTSRSKLAKFGFEMLRSPKKLSQAIKLRSNTKAASYIPNSLVLSAEGNDKLEAIIAKKGKKTFRVECDMLACGFHLVPNTELAAGLGCVITNGNVSVDEFQQTSVDDIYCAGEPTGIGGVELSLTEGKIAGLAAAENREVAKAVFFERQKLRRFAGVLNATFSLRNDLKNLPNENTFVCRCEDVTFGKLKEFNSFREAKLQARCGMGACQGRICGSACEFLFGWDQPSVRPPIFPVKLENVVD